MVVQNGVYSNFYRDIYSKDYNKNDFKQLENMMATTLLSHCDDISTIFFLCDGTLIIHLTGEASICGPV